MGYFLYSILIIFYLFLSIKSSLINFSQFIKHFLLLGNCLKAFQLKHILQFLDGMLSKCLLSSTVKVSLKASVFFLIFCLGDLFIVVSWVLKSLTNTCYGNFCFYCVCYYLAYIFSCSYVRYMYIFINIISCFWVEPLNIM